MRYTIYEHPLTHLFAFVALPHGFVEGEELPPPVATGRWFSNREEAIAALPSLLDLEDVGLDPSWEDVTPHRAAPAEPAHQIQWLIHEDARRPSGWRK
jgi:hypothetical protein